MKRYIKLNDKNDDDEMKSIEMIRKAMLNRNVKQTVKNGKESGPHKFNLNCTDMRSHCMINP